MVIAMSVNVICMKWGTKFPAKDVNVLYSMVKRHLKRDFKFICLTDDAVGLDSHINVLPLPEIDIPADKAVSPWRKLGMFSHKIGDLSGWTLFLDLDVVIMNDIDCLFDYAIAQNKLTIIENWTQKGRGVGNSSVYVFELGRYAVLLDHFNHNKDDVFSKHSNEQIYLCHYITEHLGGISYWPETWCQSFKVHCRPPFPWRYFQTPRKPHADCKVLVFHGDPGVNEALKGGFAGGKWQKYNRATPWIKDYYR